MDGLLCYGMDAIVIIIIIIAILSSLSNNNCIDIYIYIVVE